MANGNTGAPLSGKGCRVSMSGNILNMAEYNIDVQATDIDAYNYESDGYDEGVTGKVTAQIRVKGMWDGDLNPHDNPPNIRAGQILTDLKIYVDRNANRFFDFPYVRILGTPTTNQVDGKVEFEFTCKSNGIWYYPDVIAAI